VADEIRADTMTMVSAANNMEAAADLVDGAAKKAGEALNMMNAFGILCSPFIGVAAAAIQAPMVAWLATGGSTLHAMSVLQLGGGTTLEGIEESLQTAIDQMAEAVKEAFN
jgi:hypothetical protein